MRSRREQRGWTEAKAPTDAQMEEVRQAMEQSDLDTAGPYWGLTEKSAQFIFEMTTYYENVKNAVTHAPDEQELNEYLRRR